MNTHLQEVVNNFLAKTSSPAVAMPMIAAIRRLIEVEGLSQFSFNELRPILRPNGGQWVWADVFEGDPDRAAGACVAAMMRKGILRKVLDADGMPVRVRNEHSVGGNNFWSNVYEIDGGLATDPAEEVVTPTQQVADSEDDLFGDVLRGL